MDPLEGVRRRYAQEIVSRAGVRGAFAQALAHAFEVVPRERFVGPPPWRVLGGDEGGMTDDARRLYADALVALAHDRGINNGQPSLHALCLAAAHPRRGERVLQVGAGAGYYTALLAELVGEAGQVTAYEIEPDLAERARRALADRPQVQVRAASATAGPLPEADVIYASAGVSHLPAAWLDALAIGGRLVVPFTGDGGLGAMLSITRVREAAYAARFFDRVAFVDCVGARDEETARAFMQALHEEPAEAVRSLRRGGTPDHSAWLRGSGWWLSRDEP